MSSLQLFEKTVNNAIASKSNSEKLTIPLQVQLYKIDDKNPENSSVVGLHYVTREPIEFRINKSANTHQPTIDGFHRLPPNSDPKFDYSVPKNGVIMFMDCRKQDDGTYSAEWAKSAVRKKNQTLVNNFTTVKAVQQYGGRAPYIAFDSYVPVLAKSINLKDVKSSAEIENLLIESLEPRLGPDANRSLALLRVISPDLSEKVLSFEIGAIKKAGADGKQINCTGKESFDHFTKDGMGKVIFKDGAINNLIGSNLTLEVVPGMSYYAGKTTAEQYFYTSDELASQNKSEELLGTLKPKTIISVWSKMLNKVETIKDDAGNESKVRKPKVMNMYLTAAQLEDKTQLITAFNTETTNQPIYDLSEMPSAALMKVRGNVAENVTKSTVTSNPVASQPNNEQSIQAEQPRKPLAETNAKPDDSQMFDSDLSEEDIAELNMISQSMNMG